MRQFNNVLVFIYVLIDKIYFFKILQVLCWIEIMFEYFSNIVSFNFPSIHFLSNEVFRCIHYFIFNSYNESLSIRLRGYMYTKFKEWKYRNGFFMISLCETVFCFRISYWSMVYDTYMYKKPISYILLPQQKQSLFIAFVSIELISFSRWTIQYSPMCWS